MPLPVQASILPGDRVVPPELHGFMPVYHRQQYLLVPAMLNSKVKRLFALDTGIRWSTMNSDVAHSVSTTKVNFTNSMQTTSGKTLQVYRDSFDFQLANLTLSHESHVMELDSAVVNQNAGMQIAGMLGFDILHSFVLTLDYRDGLVKMESAEMGNSAGGKNQPEAEDCPGDGGDRPTDSTIEVKIKGLIDSAHLKPGKEVFAEMVNDWRSPDCTLPRGALVYGHVTSATSVKAPEASELGLVFDHAECDGGNKKPVPFALLGVIASPDQFVGLHSALPSQVAGGGRSISSAAAAVGDNFLDINLNPSGPPHTVHPGIVLGLPQTELQPHGAPGCSAKISSTRGGGVRLSTGAELILVMLQIVPAAQ